MLTHSIKAPPIDGNLKVIGDKVVVEYCEDQSLDNEDHIIKRIESHEKPFTKAIVRFIGNRLSQPSIHVGLTVIVNTFTGGSKIAFGDKTLKLLNTDDVLAIIS